VAQYITSNCQRPLALVRPKEAEWEHVEHGEAPPAEELEALQQQLESAVTRAAQNDEVRLSMVLRHDTLIHV